MPTTWILVTDARHARVFARDARSHELIEQADFIQPHTGRSADPAADDRHGGAAKGHGRTAHSGTQFEPHKQDSEKARDAFARQLADHLNQGVGAQRCDALALIATSPMLGAIRPHLSAAATRRLRCSVATDLTHYQGQELHQRINEALALPA